MMPQTCFRLLKSKYFRSQKKKSVETSKCEKLPPTAATNENNRVVKIDVKASTLPIKKQCASQAKNVAGNSAAAAADSSSSNRRLQQFSPPSLPHLSPSGDEDRAHKPLLACHLPNFQTHIMDKLKVQGSQFKIRTPRRKEIIAFVMVSSYLKQEDLKDLTEHDKEFIKEKLSKFVNEFLVKLESDFEGGMEGGEIE